MYGHVVFVVGLDALVRVRGVVWTVITTFVISPFYIAVVVEAVLLYLSVHILLPRRLANSDLDVHFLDPRQMGGFRPLGNLLKRSYYLYTAGLLLYLAWIYGPVVVPDEFVVSATTEAEDGTELVMGVRHREYPIEAVQFHPESVLTAVGHDVIRNFLAGL